MERVDLYDENRIPLGITAERQEHRNQKRGGMYRTVVHVCIFNSRGQLLIQRRSAQKEVFPEKWDVSAAGGVRAGETSRQGAEREVREELGYALDLTGVRASVTVNFDRGFDDFYIVKRDVELSALKLQTEEVSEVRWATLAEVQELLQQEKFIAYPESFLRFLFDMQDTFGFVTK